MTEKRFKRYLLDGGFWFDEYIKPVWSITDTQNKENPISFIEFKDEYKDLCDDIVDELNNLYEENEQLKQELFETRKDYIIETADISDKLYLDELIEEARKEIFE